MPTAEMETEIRHTGRVVEIRYPAVRVEIVRAEGCGTCEARTTCALHGETRHVWATTARRDLNPGDEVGLTLKRGSLAWGVGLAYGLPTIVALGVAGGMVALGMSEAAAALGGLGGVGICYGVLWLMRHKTAKHFNIEIETKETV